MRELPQRRLAYELKIAIDRVRRSRDRRYGERLMSLISANPRGVWSSHVQHNLGAERRAWLAGFARGDPFRVVANLEPLVSEEGNDGQEAHPDVGSDPQVRPGLPEPAPAARADGTGDRTRGSA